MATMDSSLFFRITGFCVYNSIMIYLQVWRPHYTLVDLKEDISTSLLNYRHSVNIQLIPANTWYFEDDNESAIEYISNEFPRKSTEEEFSSWRVEYDDNIHPVAVNKREQPENTYTSLLTKLIR